MIAKAMKYIKDLAMATVGAETIVTDDGRRFYFYNGNIVANNVEGTPKALKLHTLTALADFLRNEDEYTRYPANLIVVEDEKHVTLYGQLQERTYERPVLARVEPLDAYRFQFNYLMDPEQFIIGLQACFMPTEARDLVIGAVAGMKHEEGESLSDDGMCQQITVKRGMSLNRTQELPNPVELVPFRTFSEVMQPESKFILRASDRCGEPEIGLFEADAGAWKNTAALRIRDWLKSELEGSDVIIIG